MRKLAFSLAAVALCALGVSLTDRVEAADLSGASVKKVHIVKPTAQRLRVQRDPCFYGASRTLDHYGSPHAYGHGRAGLVYIRGDSFRDGFCLSLNTGPRFHPGWSWGWGW